jgi:hypothetical protein
MSSTEMPELGGVIESALEEEQALDAAEQDGAGGAAAAQAEVPEEQACAPVEGFTDEERTQLMPEDPTAAGNIVTVDKLDGVPLFYERDGSPRQHSFSIEAGFRDTLLATIRSVRARVPASFGALTRITTAGTFVGKAGMHGLARAMDHDAWTFEHVDIRPLRHDHDSPQRARRQRYWALAAVMRSHSAFVLHGFYNAAHEDHIHQDDGGPRPFTTGSEATVKLVQAICRHIYGEPLGIDGDFGGQSQAAVARVLARIDVTGSITEPAAWTTFLRRSGRIGFKASMQH